MSTIGIIVTVVAVIVIALIAVAVWTTVRRRQLQNRFGPEYERLVAEQPNRSAAEHELRAREQRHADLDLQPLGDDDRRRYLQEWTSVQATFVENPAAAVTAADGLITRVMADRGYPTDDFENRVQTLSVDHARTLDHYRRAHEISSLNGRGEASTEQLRQAVVHYRALATDLLDVDYQVPRDTSISRTQDERNIR